MKVNLRCANCRQCTSDGVCNLQGAPKKLIVDGYGGSIVAARPRSTCSCAASEARHAYDPRALLLLAPGWVRTDMGGPEARLSIEESIPNLQAINPPALAETGEGRRQSWWRSSAAFEQREQLMN
jgi:hypothetical protein